MIYNNMCFNQHRQIIKHNNKAVFWAYKHIKQTHIKKSYSKKYKIITTDTNKKQITNKQHTNKQIVTK